MDELLDELLLVPVLLLGYSLVDDVEENLLPVEWLLFRWDTESFLRLFLEDLT